MVLVIDTESGVFVGLDPALWSPLPLGISMYVKDEEIAKISKDDWHVWEKDNRAGARRSSRSEVGLETLVAFRSNRLLDFAMFERQSRDLGLDTSLRFRAAKKLQKKRSVSDSHLEVHSLEDQFGLSSSQILDLISARNRLAVAVRGGVAEYHLERYLELDDYVLAIQSLDLDATHDFDIETRDGQKLRIECKNVSPHSYADGDFKVETQKTRGSKGDPASRFYPVDGFDIVAACLYSATGKWEFRFARTESLVRHTIYPDRLAPMQRVGSMWKRSLQDI